MLSLARQLTEILSISVIRGLLELSWVLRGCGVLARELLEKASLREKNNPEICQGKELPKQTGKAGLGWDQGLRLI